MIFFNCQRNFGCPNIFCSWRKCPRPPASGIPRDGLQCTEHLKYMGTICGGTVVLNDLEEFGRFEADEKSISRQMPRSQMSWKTLESPGSNQRLADQKIALYRLRQILNYKTDGPLVNVRRMTFQSTQKTTEDVDNREVLQTEFRKLRRKRAAAAGVRVEK